MDLKKLRSFVAVVDEGSFSKAAEITFQSQPTISLHIAAIEKEYGCQLIHRSRSNIHPTPRGTLVYDYAKQMVKLASAFEKRWESNAQHRIQIGVSTIPAAYILPEAVSRFKMIRPDIRFIIEQDDSMTIIRQLQNGMYDIALVGTAIDEPDLEFIPFCEDAVTVITANTEYYSELKHNKVALDYILRNSPNILREQGSATQKQATLYLDSMGISLDELEVMARIADPEAIKKLVAADLGVAIVSKRSVVNEVEQGKLLTFDIPAPLANRKLYIAYSKERRPVSAVLTFAESIKSVAKELS